MPVYAEAVFYFLFTFLVQSYSITSVNILSMKIILKKFLVVGIIEFENSYVTLHISDIFIVFSFHSSKNYK